MSYLRDLSYPVDEANEFSVRATFQNSVTTNIFRYRMKVGVQRQGSSSINYYYSETVSRSDTITTTYLTANVFGASASTTYNITAIIEYYDTGDSNASWQETTNSACMLSGTHTTPAAAVSLSGTISNVTIVPTVRSAKFSWTFNADYKSGYYYKGYLTVGSSSVSQGTSVISGSSTPYTFPAINWTGLSPDTQYYYTIEMYGGESSSSLEYIGVTDSGYFWTEEETAESPSGTITNVSIDADYTEATVYWNFSTSCTSGYYYSWYVQISEYSGYSSSQYETNATTISGSSLGQMSASFTNLKKGTMYYYRIIMYGAYGSGDHYELDRKESTFLTDDDTVVGGTIGMTIDSVIGTRAVANTIFRPSNEDTTLVYREIIYVHTSNSVSENTYTYKFEKQGGSYYQSRYSGSDMRMSIDLSGFQNNTNYWARVYVLYGYDISLPVQNPTGVYSDAVPFQTSEQLTPMKWAWYSYSGSWNESYANAQYDQIYNAYQAVHNKMSCDNFSYIVWNDLVDWVCHLITAYHGSYSSTTVNSAKMTSNSRTLSAVRWNALGSLVQTLNEKMTNSLLTFVTKESGDIVYGDLFTNLTTNINNAIDRET